MTRLLILLLVVVSVPRLGSSQTVSATSGAINGRVVDNSGAVLPGVTVTASSPAMMGTRTAVTNEDGFYRFPAVPPGQYALGFEIVGFQAITRTDIRVGLGFTATVNVDMPLASLQESVTVTGASPIVDTQATQVTSTFSADTIKNLPFTGEYWSLLSVTPAVQMAAVDVGGSQALSPVGYTVYGMNTQHRPMVEGIVATWGSGGADMYYADFNSFSEVALNAAGNGAESPSPGMQSNFISKSGGNQFKGSVYFDYEHGDWQSTNIDAAQLAAGISGGLLGIRAEDTNRLLEYRKVSADIGGFAVKDKLWWYYAYSQLKNEVRLVNVIGATKKSEDPTHSAKVTYNLNEKATFIGYLQTSHKQVDPYLSGSQLTRVTAASALWNPGSPWLQSYKAGVWKGEYNQVLGSNLFLEARAGNWYAHWRNESLASDQYRFEDLNSGMIVGGGRRYDDIRDRPQVLASVSYFKNGWIGSHNLKIGGELLRENDDQFDGGFYRNVLMVLRSGAPAEVTLFESPNDTQNGLWARSAYVTDTWRATPRLTMNLGVRLDTYRPFLEAQTHQAGPNNPADVTFEAVPALVKWNHVAPRVGVVYDVTGRSKTVAKVNYGSYWWNPASDLAGTLNPNQLLWWKRYAWTDPNGNGVFDQGEQGALLATNGGTATERIDPALENTYTRQVMATIEHELAPNFGVRTGFVWVGNRNLRTRVNQNQPFDAFSVPVAVVDPGPDGRAGTADDVGPVTAYNLAAQYVGLPTLNLTQNLPNERDDFYTWELSGERRMHGGWSIQASYARTWNQRSALATNPNLTINREDGQDRFVAWQAKISGTFDLPKGVRMSPMLRHQAGANFGRTFTAATNAGTMTILAQPFEANRTRNSSVVDIRAEKSFRILDRRLAGFVDLYNIFNVNPESAVVSSSGGTWLRPTTILPPRILKLGVKLDW